VRENGSNKSRKVHTLATGNTIEELRNGAKNIFKSEVAVLHYAADPKPVNNLFSFSKLSNEKKLTENIYASVL